MKKIGVVTTHYASNYGALLQTFALQKYLLNLGYDAEVLAYYPKHYKDYWRVMPRPTSKQGLIFLAYRLLHPKGIFNTFRRLSKMKRFIREDIRCSKSYSSLEEIMADDPKYDYLICGSDQIWNVTRHPTVNKVWFLQLDGKWSDIPRIAYAPSMTDPIPKDMKEEVSQYINTFKALSVREASDVNQLATLTDKKIEHVCDPVFLLSPEDWQKYIVEPKRKKPYILCYFLSPSKTAIKLVDKLKELTGMEVVLFHINLRKKVKCDKVVGGNGVFEFPGYVKNAAYVVTNSFHCTAFSVLFQKNVFIVKRPTANSRIESLTALAGIGDRFFDDERISRMTKADLEIDYSQSSSKMNDFIKHSKNYLEKALEG